MLACIEDIYQYVFRNILVYIGGTYWYVLAILFGMFLGEVGGNVDGSLPLPTKCYCPVKSVREQCLIRSARGLRFVSESSINAKTELPHY
jgi:hypothetical protein